eukprot:TRINITY_DN27715_c0_g1_i1.p1 TRINITY_DN27715_c0_g1~~TRINITY_DN27715_c0_g1_i1.p1  ORF type:complete len:109 (+),score=8.45 TRINITY_DN27715_c0_g1_i1:2-328(+)
MVVIVGFFFQAEDGIRDLVRSRGLGDVYKRQGVVRAVVDVPKDTSARHVNVNASMVLVMLILQDVRASSIGQGMPVIFPVLASLRGVCVICLLYTSDAADEEDSVYLG